MDGGNGNGTMKEEAMVFKPGYYYRKDKKEKVSNSSGTSEGKALGKPIMSRIVIFNGRHWTSLI